MRRSRPLRSALLSTLATAGLTLLAPGLCATTGSRVDPARSQDGSARQEASAEEAADTDAKKDEKWDVDRPPWDTFENPVDTDEGTWINLDVSPDGTRIVFDLLGDLYVLPITGGEATSLTSGMAWDMQPRFSPDGASIAFTSDRTGKDGKAGDNLWVIDADGGHPRQITAESFRLVSGPAWTPDGESLVGRKHFTSRRSLGAGEMWLYHRSGVKGGFTAGVQLTQKPNDQKDVNEPIFDPTGRYLYYSMDSTPGSSFEYNKDSNGQIYTIHRLDLEKQETETYISGPGGACRPVPSPDGKVIAFVRRVGPKTGLHLFDTNSGAVRLLYDGLERDNQEAWAIHGVYPAFDWTPDGRSIVFWAGGKIQRIDVESREVRVIPFHVKDTRTVSKAVRFPIEVAPDEFDVHLTQGAQVSPAGDRVVYQALGHLYVKALPDGEPRRLTAQDDHFEFQPSLSRDGTQVVYVTWSDATTGSVRVVSIDGGEGRVVVGARGHYVEPVFSPDGSKIVYRTVRGGFLTTPLWSRDTGVYCVPAAGGAPVLVTERGRRPRFGAREDRLFLERASSEANADNLELYSVDLGGHEERSHATTTWGTDYAISHDGRWLAFVENHKVHVTRLLDAGQKLAIGPSMKALPVATASEEAGGWVHFSGDGGTLHWSLGATLYSRALDDCFAFLDGAADDDDDAPGDGDPGDDSAGSDDKDSDAHDPVITETSLSFPVAHAKPDGRIALIGARVVTMNGDQVVDDGVVLIDGNRITAVGTRGAVEVPADAHVVDVTGRVITPGLVDVHAHGGQATSGLTPQQNWIDLARLAFGVTTIHDPSNDTIGIFAASELTRAGRIDAPRTFSTGTILYGAAGSYHAEIQSLDDARFHLRRMQAVGAFSVKSYNQPRRDQRQQVLQAARELGMMVVPEGGSTFMHNLTMVVDGHTGIEHNLPVQNVYRDVLQLWKDTEVGYTPTHVVAYGGLSGEYYWYQHDDVFANPRLKTFLPPQVLQPRARRRQKSPESDYNHLIAARTAKKLVDLGATAQAGGHGQLQGIDTHWELWMFVQGGMTPFEALRSGTLHGARYLGLDGDLGSLAPGKLADLVIYEEGRDPTRDIRDSEHIDQVIANGVIYDAHTMDRVHPDPRPRQALYWEQDDFGVSGEVPSLGGCEGCGRAAVGAAWN